MKAMAERVLGYRRAGWLALPVVSVLLFAACAQMQTPQDVAATPVAEAAPAEVADVSADEAPIAPAEVATAPVVIAPEVAAVPLEVEASSEASLPVAAPMPDLAEAAAVTALCEEIGHKLSSVSEEDCHKRGFHDGEGASVMGRPLLVKDIQPAAATAQDFRVFIMGGIHGDEYSSVSILFKWLDLYSANGLEGKFLWRIAPLVNPDGLLNAKASRQNANGVDLNRNFPSQDWNDDAVAYWRKTTGSNPRRYPGDEAASEPEVQWLVQQIAEFQPHVIVSVHAPYHLLDFDGPAAAPQKIGELRLQQLGVYPGSLGNYAGLNKQIPVVTLELPSAGILPSQDQIDLMWHDLNVWLDREGRKSQLERASALTLVEPH